MRLGGLIAVGLMAACAPSPPRSTAPNPMPTTGVPLGLAVNPNVTEIAPDQLPPVAQGQVVYVPVYSEIYDFGPSRPFQLTATLSLRNTDPVHPIFVEAVDYYDSSGTLVTAYLSQPLKLGPLASTAVVVESGNTFGGSGANFLVTWRAATSVSDPVIEAVMISTASQQGVSFLSLGRVIEER
ncbi:hypothetical protein GFS31_04950 [Leptolyngbya sp. BL0902]|nr:hypothetical protein GFS31_04950 [Leptolyngbya sp. BL0902]